MMIIKRNDRHLYLAGMRDDLLPEPGALVWRYALALGEYRRAGVVVEVTDRVLDQLVREVLEYGASQYSTMLLFSSLMGQLTLPVCGPVLPRVDDRAGWRAFLVGELDRATPRAHDGKLAAAGDLR